MNIEWVLSTFENGFVQSVCGYNIIARESHCNTANNSIAHEHYRTMSNGKTVLKCITKPSQAQMRVKTQRSAIVLTEEQKKNPRVDALLCTMHICVFIWTCVCAELEHKSDLNEIKCWKMPLFHWEMLISACGNIDWTVRL